MSATRASRIAAALGFLAVALGAFGAHSLKNILGRNGTTTIWETAVFYHFVHAVMLFILAERKKIPMVAWWSFFVGILFFCGSLYLLALTNAKWLGAITPLGGFSFLFGWFWLMVKAPKEN
jgi:uncharacterized membrane protein YgdD (TMEM256/DUF423 family)